MFSFFFPLPRSPLASGPVADSVAAAVVIAAAEVVVLSVVLAVAGVAGSAEVVVVVAGATGVVEGVGCDSVGVDSFLGVAAADEEEDPVFFGYSYYYTKKGSINLFFLRKRQKINISLYIRSLYILFNSKSVP